MIKERYGHYTMTIDYKGNDFAQVTVHDIASNWPLVYSIPMNYKQANAALDLFKAVGFFNITE